jgi:hypothetical protein
VTLEKLQQVTFCPLCRITRIELLSRGIELDLAKQ